MLYDAEDHGQILLIGHLNPAVLIRIVAPEYIGQPLQDDAALDEVVEGDLSPSLSVKLSNEDVVKLVGQPVPLKRRRRVNGGPGEGALLQPPRPPSDRPHSL